MRLVTRAQWGARAPRSISRISNPSGTTIHWEGPTMGTFEHSSCASKVRGIQNFHMDSRGWADIAYNALVCPHGWTFEGRWLGVRSAANGTNLGNDSHYAVCALWGKNDPTPDIGKHEFIEVVAYFDAQGAGSEWKGHRDWKATECPGQPLYDWIKAGHPDPIAVVAAPSDPTPTDKAVAFTYYGGGQCYTFASDGGVYTEDVPFHGSLGDVRLNAPIIWGEALEDASGYYMVGADGGIFNFGAARQIQPYTNLFSEYAAGTRRIVAADRTSDGLILLSNLGERYTLA